MARPRTNPANGGTPPYEPPIEEITRAVVNVTPEETAIVNAELAVGGAVLLKQFDNRPLEYYATWDATTVAGRNRLMACLGKPDLTSGEIVNGTFAIEHLFVHAVRVTDSRSGEQQSCPRTVLIDPTGKRLSFVSIGVYDSLRWLVSLFGSGPYVPPINVRVNSKTTNNGGKVLYLTLADQ